MTGFRRMVQTRGGSPTRLIVALVLVFATGVGAVATGSTRGGWVAVGHGIAAARHPLSSRGRRGWPRPACGAAATRWVSLALAGLTHPALVFGLGYATGLLRSVAGVAGLWLHVAFALAWCPWSGTWSSAGSVHVGQTCPGGPPAGRPARAGRRWAVRGDATWSI